VAVAELVSLEVVGFAGSEEGRPRRSFELLLGFGTDSTEEEEEKGGDEEEEEGIEGSIV
jgi:hypothetical protein